MKVGALVHFATPLRNAGSESVLHLILKSLVAAGHEVQCWVTDCPGGASQTYDTVPLTVVRNVTLGAVQMQRWQPDIVISHHQNAVMAQRFAARIPGCKSVYLTHNDMDVNHIPLTRWKPDLVVHNSEWVKDSLQRYGNQANEAVMHPPLDCSRHKVTKGGNALTLINVNEHKGARIFYAMAERMPETEFIAVLGGHGVQIKPPRHLSNVSVVAHNPDLKPVWERTRLLLMPSIYESYGLTGVEAGCSGIPTLANPTPGLRESLGCAGQFISWAQKNLPVTKGPYWQSKEWLGEWGKPSRGHVDEWEAAARDLLADDDWLPASIEARLNSDRLCRETAENLSLLVTRMEDLRHADAKVAVR